MNSDYRTFPVLVLTSTIQASSSYSLRCDGVQIQEALRRFKHEIDLSAKIDIASFEGKQHLYALGAAEQE